METKSCLIGSILAILCALVGVGVILYLNLNVGQIEERMQSRHEVFYLSVGLYQNKTHICFNHDVFGCEAEFKGERVTFHIYSQNSSYEIYGSGFTSAKGFLDLYLPKNQTYFAEFEVKGLKDSGVLTTTPDSPTCITTIRVVE